MSSSFYARYSGLASSGSGGGTVTSVSVVTDNGLAGVVANPTTTPAITLSTTITGILQGNGTAISAATLGNLTDAGTDGISITGGSGAVLGSGTAIVQAKASSAQNGYLSSADWTTFNGKQAALTPGSISTSSSNLSIGSGSSSTVGPNVTLTLTEGNLTESTSSVLTISGGTSCVLGSGTSIQVKQASTSQSGYLSSADWNTFNGKQSTITLTTTGTSGAATLSGGTLNVPQYQAAGNYVSQSTTVNGHALSSNVVVSASDITTGTLPAAQLPSPTSSTLGGIESYVAVSNQFLTSISTAGVPVSAQPSFSNISGTASAGQIPALSYVKVIRQQQFTSSGTYTPNANMLYCIIEAVGPGGGGGGSSGSLTAAGAGGGGGAGGYCRLIASSSTIGSSQTVTIGSGGSGGSNSGGNGSNGSANTTVGSLVTAAFGSGGNGSGTSSTPAIGGPGGTGGTATNGNINITGQAGGPGFILSSTASIQGVGGSPGYLGSGGQGSSVASTGTGGNSGNNYGGGGSGGGTASVSGGQAGGSGAGGFVIITEYCSA